MSADLRGRRILVTGGATGIGAAISAALCDAGARVAVVQRTAAELDDALDASGLRERVTGLAADLSIAAECSRVVADAVAALGGLDGLVNNAAITGPPAQRTLLDIDDDYLDRVIDLNLKATVRCTIAASRHFVDNGGGVVVSVASVLAYAPAPSAALYSATKAGLLGFTRGAALELGPRGVRVLCVSPGDIATTSSVAPPAPDGGRAVRSPALGRRGDPGEIASVVAFLLSAEASYVTGSDVVIDGGFLLG
ncbi:SDR family NAD(P)-dependent oxidoreductase [Herbiconiux sp. P17]|uniref:SDR family NAD(P)-dependent oxidoreductase n=1 Tax=Herbiconiux wuyangfengii TaxID=3342794 RepID=UPI0035B88B46